MRSNRQERGFALVGAVFALVVIASLVAGAFFASMQEVNIGRNSQTYQKAFSASEGGMAMRVTSWAGVAGTLNNMAVNAETSFVDTIPNSKSTATSYIRKLNGMLYLVRTVGTSGTSSRVLGSIVKLQLANLNVKASLTTRNGLKVGGSSFINGTNTNPTGWGCGAVSDTLAGVRTPDSNLIQTSGCNNYTCIAGSPKVQQDTTVRDSTFTNFGGLTYQDLAAMATVIIPGGSTLNQLAPVGTATTCTTSNIYNWGDPYRPGTVPGCWGYFPIIHVPGSYDAMGNYINGTGNLNLTGGYGQGVLLVDGDLSVQGGFEFFGPVIVMGHFSTAGTGGHFNGGVMSSDVDLELNSVLGNAVITYSSCAIITALKGSASARLIRERRWMDLTQ